MAHLVSCQKSLQVSKINYNNIKLIIVSQSIANLGYYRYVQLVSLSL